MNAIRIEFIHSNVRNAQVPVFAKGVLTICGPDGRVACITLDRRSAVDFAQTEEHKLSFYILEPGYQQIFAGLTPPDRPQDIENWAKIAFHGGEYLGKQGWIFGQVEFLGANDQPLFSSKIDRSTAVACTCDKT